MEAGACECWQSWHTVFTNIAFYLVSFSGADGDFQGPQATPACDSPCASSELYEYLFQLWEPIELLILLKLV